MAVKLKVGHSDLRQFLAAESSYKIMKDALYFTLKALPVLTIFITALLTNNCKHISRSKVNQGTKFGQLI